MHKMLEDILTTKRSTLERILAFTRDNNPAQELGIARRGFHDALLANGESGSAPAIIAEIKHASPSRGVLTDSFEPSLIAREYERGGAVALSVLTDEAYFRGSARYILEVKRATKLPVLCKDFMIDPRQMRWAARIGADAVLLIVRILSPAQFAELTVAAKEESLDILVETHTESEIEFALENACEIIGVNCRDLDTFEVDLDRTIALAKALPATVTSVAESGIREYSDVVRLQGVNYNAFLVGESLMTSSDRVTAVRKLRGESS